MQHLLLLRMLIQQTRKPRLQDCPQSTVIIFGLFSVARTGLLHEQNLLLDPIQMTHSSHRHCQTRQQKSPVSLARGTSCWWASMSKLGGLVPNSPTQPVI